MSIAGGISTGAAACGTTGDEGGATETALNPPGEACAAGADGGVGTFSHVSEFESTADDGDAAGVGAARSAAGIDSSSNATTIGVGPAASTTATMNRVETNARAMPIVRNNLIIRIGNWIRGFGILVIRTRPRRCPCMIRTVGGWRQPGGIHAHHGDRTIRRRFETGRRINFHFDDARRRREIE